MKNTKFFVKIILALLPFLVVILITALFPFGYMDSQYPEWKYTKDMVNKDISCGNQPAEAIIIGDSRAMADVLPTEINDSTVNLAVGGATSIEMYYTLKHYIENNGVPKKVIVMFAPFHYSIIDNYTIRTEYFNYLSISDSLDLIKAAKACGSETVIYDGYLNDMLSYRLRFPDKYLPAIINAKGFARYGTNSALYNDLCQNKGYGEYGTLDGCSDPNYETNYEVMHTTGDATLLQLYMTKIFNLLSEKGIESYLVIPPMNEASFNVLKSSYVDDFSDYLYELSNRYPTITFEHEIPCYSNDLFGDSSHLNHKGAEVFTSELANKYFK